MTLKMKKKILLFTTLIVMSMFLISIASATSTIVKPVAGGNYSTTMVLNCSTDVAAALNATFYYNASGGAATTVLATITNATADATSFYSASQSIAALSDLRTYNFTCVVNNASSVLQSSTQVKAIIVDNTDAVVNITATETSAEMYKDIHLAWASSDATSGLTSTSVSVTAAGEGGCNLLSAISYTDASGSVTLSGDNTRCMGTYTATITGIDYAGNSVSTTDTFTIKHPEGSIITIPAGSSITSSGQVTKPNIIIQFINTLKNLLNNLFN